jgi:quercetin dioxygenase-like cupin family protein
MIFLNKEATPINSLPGVIRRTLAVGQSMMICEFTFEENVTIPMHTHPNEQVGYVVDGLVEMIIDDEKFLLQKGDTYLTPSNVPHGAYLHKPTIIIDTFSPPREDYR